MKRYLLILAVFCLAIFANAARIGEWTSYRAYHNATFSLQVGTKLYGIFGGNLLTYDTETKEVELLSKQTGLSSTNIQYIGYSTTSHALVVYYKDLNVDIINDDGTVVNLPQLKELYDVFYPRRNLTVCGDYALAVVGGGVALIDLTKKNIKGVYWLGAHVYSATMLDGKIYASWYTGLICGDVNDNLYDVGNWKPISAKVSSTQMVNFNGGIYAIVQKGNDRDGRSTGLWRIQTSQNGQSVDITQLDKNNYTSATVTGTSAAVFANASVANVYTEGSTATPAFSFTPANAAASMIYGSTDGDRRTIWAAEGYNGIVAYSVSDDGAVSPTGETIGFYGPKYDNCYRLRYYGDKLLMAGGRLAYSGVSYPALATTYDGNHWTTFQDEGVTDITGILYDNLTDLIQSPADTSLYYASSLRGVYAFRNAKFENYYASTNSPLVTAVGANGDPNYVFVGGLAADGEGNVWMANLECDTVLRVLRTDGTWSSIYVDALKNAPTCDNLLFDSKGRLWVTSRRTIGGSRYHQSGVLALDYGGTIDDTSDDVSLFRASAYNEDGTSVKLEAAYAIAEDKDGSILIGTESGFFVVENPDDWFSDDFRITQIKVPRNDGTNLADYLLDGVKVTAIAVDGAGRKWIGTETQGLYVVSQDGLEALHHFTAANSPLPSDYILSVAPNPVTGEVMIGTSEGLCSYQSEVSEPQPSLQKSSIKVYPNPVRPEYNGNVIVSGLTDNADVKVTTAGGQLVASGRSVGGTFVWNVRKPAGGRASSGVYFILISTADGKSSVAAKVVVI